MLEAEGIGGFESGKEVRKLSVSRGEPYRPIDSSHKTPLKGDQMKADLLAWSLYRSHNIGTQT